MVSLCLIQLSRSWARAASLLAVSINRLVTDAMVVILSVPKLAVPRPLNERIVSR